MSAGGVSHGGETVRLTAAQAMVRYLAALRIEHEGRREPLFGGVFAIFGHGNVAGLGEALYAHRQALPTYRAHNEQAMAHAAIAYAKAHFRRRMMACTTSIGPGATNLVTAAALAHVNRLPVLFIPGDVFASRAPDPVLQQVEDFHAGDVSANDCFRPVSRYFDRIWHPEQLLTALPRAIHVLTDPALCGPVTLAFPQDVQTMAFEYPQAFFEPAAISLRASAPDQRQLQRAVAVLREARRPVIVAGGGVLYSGASDALRRFADTHGVPVCETQGGKSALSWDHPLQIGAVGVTGSTAASALARDADAVLAVGTRLYYPFSQWGVDKRLAIVRVDSDPDEPARQHKPKVALIGDAAAVLRRLIDNLPGFNAARPSRHEEMQERQAAMRARLAARIAPQIAFLDAIRAELPEDGILVDEVTQIGFAARLAFPVYRPRTFLSPGYQDNLGWGYATALGAQHARPEVPVLSINGDGGFLYTANELATAMRHRIPLIAVVFADGAFGNVRRIQEEDFGNRTIACDLANPDFVKFAESFGAAGRRAHGPNELRRCLREAFAAREPTIIEVPVGPMPSPWEFIHMPPVRGR